MAVIRRKPRIAFAYVLQADRSLPVEEQPRFIIQPPTESAWAKAVDDSTGTASLLVEAVALFVDRLEGHPDAAAFGEAGTPARRAFVDEHLGFEVIREVGNAVAETLLSECDRGN